MKTIAYEGGLTPSECPVCPELVTIRREINPGNFAVRYWVFCKVHGPICDLLSWMDQQFTPTVHLTDDEPPAIAA